MSRGRPTENPDEWLLTFFLFLFGQCAIQQSVCDTLHEMFWFFIFNQNIFGVRTDKGYNAKHRVCYNSGTAVDTRPKKKYKA